jgi:hypothetical protein
VGLRMEFVLNMLYLRCLWGQLVQMSADGCMGIQESSRFTS